MHVRSLITEDQYRAIYNASKDRLRVFSTISDNGGGFRNPFSGEMMTEWGFPGDECPQIGTAQTWVIDPMTKERSSVQTQYWLCIPKYDTDF